MKYKIYRGTKLSEGLQLVEHKPSKKFLYRFDTKEETLPFARSAKRDDEKYEKGSIVEAEADIPKNLMITISHEQYGKLHKTKSKMLDNKVGYYKVGSLKIFLIPPKLHYLIKNPKIVEVI